MWSKKPPAVLRGCKFLQSMPPDSPSLAVQSIAANSYLHIYIFAPTEKKSPAQPIVLNTKYLLM